MANDLIIQEPIDVAKVFTAGGMEGVLKEIEAVALAHVPDVETDSGRLDIASLAYKIARSKTLIDSTGKEVISDWKKKTDRINGLRKQARDFLDDLKTKVRQPLSDWEFAEQKRKAEEDARQEAVIKKRVADLLAVEVIISFLEVATMTDDEFQCLLGDKTFEFEERKKAKAEAEAAEKKRLEKEAADRKAEDERLAKQKKEQEVEAERLAKIQIEIEAKFKAVADEKKRIEREWQETKDRIARKEADKQAAENAKIQAKKDAEDLAKHQAKEAAEAEEIAKIKAARREALKPDKEKLIDWIKGYGTNPIPEIENKEVAEILRVGLEYINKTLNDMLIQVEELL